MYPSPCTCSSTNRISRPAPSGRVDPCALVGDRCAGGSATLRVSRRAHVPQHPLQLPRTSPAHRSQQARSRSWGRPPAPAGPGPASRRRAPLPGRRPPPGPAAPAVPAPAPASGRRCPRAVRARPFSSPRLLSRSRESSQSEYWSLTSGRSRWTHSSFGRASSSRMGGCPARRGRCAAAGRRRT